MVRVQKVPPSQLECLLVMGLLLRLLESFLEAPWWAAASVLLGPGPFALVVIKGDVNHACILLECGRWWTRVVHLLARAGQAKASSEKDAQRLWPHTGEPERSRMRWFSGWCGGGFRCTLFLEFWRRLFALLAPKAGRAKSISQEEGRARGASGRRGWSTKVSCAKRRMGLGSDVTRFK